MRTPTGIEADVCRDIADRQKMGLAKYGIATADNPLPLSDWLQHAYEETLDKAIYLKRAMKEIETLPAAIAEDLFTNGSGVRCDRLVHTHDTNPPRYGGGWCLGAVIDRVRKLL